VNDDIVAPTPLPIRNEMHYDGRVFERVDWSQRGAYMKRKHGITAEVADDALGDANRIVIDPDYNSTSGESIRIIGYSILANDIITVIVVEARRDRGRSQRMIGQCEGPPHLHRRQR
jgi:hypothetical protein